MIYYEFSQHIVEHFHLPGRYMSSRKSIMYLLQCADNAFTISNGCVIWLKDRQSLHLTPTVIDSNMTSRMLLSQAAKE